MNFIAKVEVSQLEKIREIAGSLEKIGVKVQEVLPVLGLITGSSESLSLEQVKIDGIAAVELDRKWGAGMPKREREAGKEGAEGKGRDLAKSKEVGKHVVAKRSGGKAKRKE